MCLSLKKICDANLTQFRKRSKLWSGGGDYIINCANNITFDPIKLNTTANKPNDTVNWQGVT
jgi:hypothetical protein